MDIASYRADDKNDTEDDSFTHSIKLRRMVLFQQLRYHWRLRI